MNNNRSVSVTDNLNFFDKREQCQTRLSNAERRKNL